jgi:peptidoglycan/xylan/chitin deacetylase (PgdA/CDA1 family)
MGSDAMRERKRGAVKGLVLAIAIAAGAWTASAAPPANVDAPIIEHGPRNSKQVALTFDACRTSLHDDYDGPVIDVLMREHVPATIFMSGRWADRNPDKAALLAAQPQFEIANHGYWHPHLLEKDDAGVLADLRLAQKELKLLTGKTPRYFRAPFGEVDERIARLAAKAGLVTIQYDIASGDPDPNLKAERIVRAVLREAKGGSIVVFHVNRHGVHTAEELPAVIAGLRAKGFALVTVGEMLRETAGKARERGEEGKADSEVPGDRPTSVTTEEY